MHRMLSQEIPRSLSGSHRNRRSVLVRFGLRNRGVLYL